jgi:hypothetical protein
MIGHPLGLAFLVLTAAAAVLIVAYSLRVGITPMPSSGAARQRILELIPADLGGTILELGAGWGGLAVALSRCFPAAQIVAYELSPVPWLVARLRVAVGRHRNLSVRRCDFLRVSLAEADAVVCYLYPGAMEALAKKLSQELRPGTPVVTHAFRLPGWTPEREVAVPELWRSTTFLYRSPA